MLIVRKSRPRLIKHMQIRKDGTSKKILKFLNEHTSQFTNQNKLPVVNMLSCMPTISFLELTLMLVDLDMWEWFIVVTSFGFTIQLDTDEKLKDLFAAQARDFWTNVVKMSTRVGAGFEKGSTWSTSTRPAPTSTR